MVNKVNVELIEEGTVKEPLVAISEASSECYDSDAYKKLGLHVIDSGHLSVAEHAKFQFRVSGVSRVLTHQLVRKRIGASYSQRSQRYVNEENFGYVTPDSVIAKGYEDKFDRKMTELSELYSEMVADGVPKEDARYVFPNAIFTSLHLSMNVRSLIDFCKVRMCNRSQWEIRELAYTIRRRIHEVSPELAEFLMPSCKHLGYCPEGDKCCGYMPTKKEVLGSD